MLYKFYSVFPMATDIIDAYSACRKRGIAREAAVDQLCEEYRNELADCDDRPVVWIGIALALCKKDELTQNVLENARAALRELYKEHEDSDMHSIFHELEIYICDPQRLGEAAKHRVRKPYIPQWEIGDTFAHVLTHPMAKYANVYGWYVLFRKVGEHVDHEERHRQLIYVTLCPPDQLPGTSEELHRLGFLRMMSRGGKKWDYLAQLVLKSKKDEAAYGLTRIGTFPDAGAPKDRTTENPLVTMPLFGKLKRDSLLPDYEDTVCQLYRRNGIGI